MADKILREAAIVCGVPAWRASIVWAGVWIGGSGAWDADGPKQPPGVLPSPDDVMGLKG